MKTKRLTERDLRKASSSFVSYTELRRDVLAKTRALKKIAKLCNEYGNGVTLDMVVAAVHGVALRALGEA